MRLKNTKQDVVKYLSQWINTETWDDLSIIHSAVELGVPNGLEYMADHVVSTGAIDPTKCYEYVKTLEQDVITLAKRFRALPKRIKENTYKHIFKNVLMIDCKDCNHVSFVNDGNENIYRELKTECWNCASENLNIRRQK